VAKGKRQLMCCSHENFLNLKFEFYDFELEVHETKLTTILVSTTTASITTATTTTVTTAYSSTLITTEENIETPSTYIQNTIEPSLATVKNMGKQYIYLDILL